MKLCQKICPIDILDKCQSGSSCLKNMATSGRGIFPYMDLWIFMKLCQYICLNDILDVYENGSGLLKNVAARVFTSHESW